MKTNNKIRNDVRALVFIIALIIVSLSSCEIHIHDDEDIYIGDAYLALSYDYMEPDYIDIQSFPNMFRWDKYYSTQEGEYIMYYGWDDVEWEVSYVIWVDEGYGYQDVDDVYFTLVCNPDGGFVEHRYGFKNSEGKSLPKGVSLVSYEEDTQVYLLTKKGYKMEATYKRK